MSCNVKLSFFKLGKEVTIPTYGTSLSTCFDFKYYPTDKKTLTAYDKHNIKVDRRIENDGSVYVHPKDRILIPTGLIVRINSPLTRNFSLRIHGRSGLALKKGLVLANSEGVVDLDYNQETFAIINNISDGVQKIEVGERICQGEIVENILIEEGDMSVFDTPFEDISERNGGFGSTGSK